MPIFTLPPTLAPAQKYGDSHKQKQHDATDEEETEEKQPIVVAESPRDKDDKKGRRIGAGRQTGASLRDEVDTKSRKGKSKGRKAGVKKYRKKLSRRLLTTTEDPTSAFINIDEISESHNVQPTYTDKVQKHHEGEVQDERIDIGIWNLPIVKWMSQRLRSREQLMTQIESESTLKISGDENDTRSGTMAVRL